MGAAASECCCDRSNKECPDGYDRPLDVQRPRIYPLLPDCYDILVQLPLGNGLHGKIVTCRDRVVHASYAVKTVPKREHIDLIAREVNIRKSLDHPNLLGIVHAFEDVFTVKLVLELCRGGSLQERLPEAPHLMTDGEAAPLVEQLFRGVSYLHEHNVCHRNVHPDNILFQRCSNEPSYFTPREGDVLKLSGFSLARGFEDGQGLTTKIGAAHFIAPQVFEGHYDYRCDMWSCGVVVHLLLCGCLPFAGGTDSEVMAKVRVGSYSLKGVDVSEAGKSLIRGLLRISPIVRFSAERALKHDLVVNTPRLKPAARAG